MRSKIRIILLTALKKDVDRKIGLEIGAVDYLERPFNPCERVARIRAALRRGHDENSALSETRRYRFEGFVADPLSHTVTDPEGGEVELIGAEFDLLLTFLERPGRVLSRNQLLDLTHGAMAARGTA
jgi:two-component system phosphate regulon response regulator OmpR